MIQPTDSSFPLSIKQQYKLIEKPVSTYYYKQDPEDPFNLELMEIIDKQYMKTSFYGIRRITQCINKYLKDTFNFIYSVNHKKNR